MPDRDTLITAIAAALPADRTWVEKVHIFAVLEAIESAGYQVVQRNASARGVSGE
jgi:hypothetical protein